MVLIVTMNAHSYIDAHSYTEDRITDACAHRRRAHVRRACARACGCGFGHARMRAEFFPVCVDRVWLGAQAFQSASAFNANIGAWNTAAVTTLSYVCAAPGPAARTTADALGRASVRRGRLCAAAPPMRVRVSHTCRHSLCAGPWV